MEQIPFNRLSPQHDASINDALLSVVKDDWFILGTRLEAFEREYARFTGVSDCIGMGNGHDALVLALWGLGLGSGTSTGIRSSASGSFRPAGSGRNNISDADEVLVPANTCTATWLAITNAGCVPVPVEPHPLTLNIDPLRIGGKITPRTRAIMPVHLYGNPCDMGPIMELARKHHLKVVEDNAQAHGASLMLPEGEKLTGSFGDVNATSFYPTKNLGALGDGGAVTTNDKDVAARIRVIRNYGYSSKDVCDVIGVNSRLDEIQAAVLSIKLSRLESWNEERRSIASLYDEMLNGCGDIILPKTTPGGKHVYHIYVVQTEQRKELQQHLNKQGIQTLIHYPIPPHLQKAYEGLGYRRGEFPVAERLSDTVLSLPLWIGMRQDQVMKVADEIRRFFGK